MIMKSKNIAISFLWASLYFASSVFRDTMIVGFGNIATSLFAGLVIFSIIGYLSNELQMPIDKVVDQGMTLWGMYQTLYIVVCNLLDSTRFKNSESHFRPYHIVLTNQAAPPMN